MALTDFLQKGATGLVTAALVSFGGLVLSEHVQQAVQGTQMSALAAHQADTDGALKHLDESIQSLDKNVAVLAERVKEDTHGKR